MVGSAVQPGKGKNNMYRGGAEESGGADVVLRLKL